MTLKPLDLLICIFSILMLGCLALAFIDPAFRPVFGEIIKSLVSGAIQGLITKI